MSAKSIIENVVNAHNCDVESTVGPAADNVYRLRLGYEHRISALSADLHDIGYELRFAVDEASDLRFDVMPLGSSGKMTSPDTATAIAGAQETLPGVWEFPRKVLVGVVVEPLLDALDARGAFMMHNDSERDTVTLQSLFITCLDRKRDRVIQRTECLPPKKKVVADGTVKGSILYTVFKFMFFIVGVACIFFWVENGYPAR